MTYDARKATKRSWYSMRSRCTNQRLAHFRNYGGRGITISPRWDSFEKFVADLGERPEGTTLDRINNDGNYEPGNCRWATIAVQSRNRRTARNVILAGQSVCMADAARIAGVSLSALRAKVAAGLSPDEAVAQIRHAKTHRDYSRTSVRRNFSQADLAHWREVISATPVNAHAARILGTNPMAVMRFRRKHMRSAQVPA